MNSSSNTSRFRAAARSSIRSGAWYVRSASSRPTSPYWARTSAGPTALVWGVHDPVLGRALGRHEALFPDAEVTRVEAGHFLQEEVPDELAAAVRRLVAKVEDSAADTA